MNVIVCSIGCFAQIIILTVQYMKYEMSTSVEFVFPEIMKMPHITMCAILAWMLDWNNMMLKSHCFNVTGEYCFGNYSMKFFGIKARVQDIRLESTDSGKTSHGSFPVTNRESITWISKTCDNVCRKRECHQVLYIPKIKSSDSMTANKREHWCFLPSSPSVLSESSAKISFESYATDLSSTLGFWLGVSVISDDSI